MKAVAGRRSRSVTGVVAVLLTLATLVGATPVRAAGGDTGLYGSADPTYDGVFRQSLAIIGLAGEGIAPPKSAITWLLDQQCADGSFQAYRADPAVPCAKADPVAYTGPDTNQTALALLALMALDDSRVPVAAPLVSRIVTAADRAGRWLGRAQNPDGGWPYYRGGASDANSTGLSLSAIMSQAPNNDVPAYRKAARYLRTVSSSCASGGGFSYQAGGKVNASATAQGLLGLTAVPPVRGPRPLAVGAPCGSTAKAKGTSYLATVLASSGLLPSSVGDGPDYPNTATAVVALVGAGKGRAAVARATRALKAGAATFVNDPKGTDPGALGLLLQVASATGSDATSFGGINLVDTLASTLRR